MIEYNKEIKISKNLVNGYQYFCDSKHPLATDGGWVYYHRHIASLKEGRWLLPEEHVHHIDSNKLNNNPDNLAVMTNKEHSILEAAIRGYDCKEYFCINCGNKLKRKTAKGLCLSCLRISQRKFNPTKEELEKLIWKMPMTFIAEKFSVSDKAIKKRCNKLEINVPPMGYWLKTK